MRGVSNKHCLLTFFIWGNVICFTAGEMLFCFTTAGEMLFVLQPGKCYSVLLQLGKCYLFYTWGNVICFTAGETHFPLVQVTTAVLSRETPIILLLNKSHPMVPSGVLGLSDQSLVEL